MISPSTLNINSQEASFKITFILQHLSTNKSHNISSPKANTEENQNHMPKDDLSSNNSPHQYSRNKPFETSLTTTLTSTVEKPSTHHAT